MALTAGCGVGAVQDITTKIEDEYRVRLILDNLPITTYDLEQGPESVRPGEPRQLWICPGGWHALCSGGARGVQREQRGSLPQNSRCAALQGVPLSDDSGAAARSLRPA